LHKSTPTFFKHLVIELSIILTIVTILQGCGRKGAPIPPRIVVPPAVTDLGLNMDGDIIRLMWSVPQSGGKPAPEVAGFIVYRSKTMLTDACQKCPIQFRQVADVVIGTKGSRKEPLLYTETLESGYEYRYKVTAYTRKRIMGGESNVVSIQR